jgi:hypothetical protein
VGGTADGQKLAGSVLIQPPIVVDYNGDVCVFATVAEAEAYLEPSDVDAAHLFVYDSAGRLLQLTDASRLFSDRVALHAAEHERSLPAAARDRLLYYLRFLGDPSTDLETAPIATLAARALSLQSRSR